MATDRELKEFDAGTERVSIRSSRGTAPGSPLGAASPRDFRLEAFLPYRLNQLAERASRTLATVYSQRFDLSIPQWRVLATLHAAPGLTARDVAKRATLDKVTVSRALARLAERDLVDRRACSRDGRASELRLSPAGRRLFARIAPLALAWERELLVGLTDRERDLLGELIGKLDAGLAAMTGSGESCTTAGREAGTHSGD